MITGTEGSNPSLSDPLPSERWIDIPYRAELAHAGLRLDAFLRERLKGRSRVEIQQLIESGRVSLRGRSLKAATRVKAGETVLVRYERRADPPAAFDSLTILFEDEHLIAVDKPGRLLSHPTDKVRRNSATEILSRQLGGARVHLVHRLDRETSGVLLLTKTREAAATMTDAFTRRAVAKEYLAVVHGRIAWDRKTVDAPLAAEGREIKVRQKAAADGSPAITEFFHVGFAGDRSLILAKPKTGRLHQIRAHLALTGHPVVGDKLYHGNGEAYLKAMAKTLEEADIAELGAARQLLHARKARFPHPATGRTIEIVAPIPTDFWTAFD